MFQTQLRKTFKSHGCLFEVVEHLQNTRTVHQLHKDLDESTADFKFPLRNTQKPVNNQHFSQCIHKPLTINHHVSDSVGGKRIYLEKYPSVTTILSNTKPPNEFFGLMNWRKVNIEKFGKEKFELMQRDTTMKGTTFHQEMKEYFAADSNNECNTLATSGFLKSVCDVLPNISNPLAVESSVVHSSLGYAGTVDLVAEYMGVLSLIDWKTSQKKKTNLAQCHSYPIQVSAYTGAINFDLDYPFQISNGVLVIAYENGDPADVHIMNEQLCEEYWEKWLFRLHQYKAVKSRRTSRVIEGRYNGTCLSPDEKGTPQEKPCEGDQMCENAKHMESPLRKQDHLRVSLNFQPKGKLLNEIGKTVKDEEILATWRDWTGLTESIFGRVFISKGLLMFHYVTSLLKTSMNKMNITLKKGKQLPQDNTRKRGSA